MESNRPAVLLTGAAGCLGNALLAELTCVDLFGRLDWVDLVFAMDIAFIPYQHTSRPYRWIQQDITDRPGLDRFFHEHGREIRAIIHSASHISVGHEPDEELMWKVNYEGTVNLINLAQTFEVPYFVYTSTADVMIPADCKGFIKGTERGCPPPGKRDRYMIHPYALTKRKAEQLVLKNDTVKGMRTIALRPVTLYGEGDRHFIFNSLLQAKANGGVIHRVGNGSALFPVMYVRNAARAHLCALDSLLNPLKVNSISGDAYIVLDDTPRTNIYNFVAKFLPSHGFQVSSQPLSYSFLCFYIWIWTLLYHWFFQPLFGWKLGTSLPTLSELRYTVTNISFSDAKARKDLDYRPIYGSKEAERRAKIYYRSLKVP